LDLSYPLRSTPSRRLPVNIATSKDLLACPCFPRGSVHGEVLVQQQIAPPRLFQHRLEECFGNVAGRSPLRIKASVVNSR
jgi:hypothetical protein